MLLPDDSRILLVLDVDETLVYTCEEALPTVEADFRVLGYHVHKRPGLDQFLSIMAGQFHLAFWSAAGSQYIARLIPLLTEPHNIEPAFVWAGTRCTRRFDPETQETYHIKDFNKLRRRGVNLRRALIVDDLPRNCVRNYGNAIYIKPFEGDASDRELSKLADYLHSLKDLEDVRIIEKRGWEK